MYCIVDVETTGGKARFEKLTEIAIVKHDGQKVLDSYTTLINPERFIPHFITQLTGITNDMVASAPRFYEVAKDIVEFTKGCVFVAHNVAFDYSFVRKEFAELGFSFQRRTLCTVRLARKLVPGLPKYGLASLCKHFAIPLVGHHRAMEDAKATAELFTLLWKLNQQGIDFDSIQEEVKTTLLPRHLPMETYQALPNAPGVYYFHNQTGDIIYVGKSKHIKQRVSQHFQDDHKTRKGELFKDTIHDVSYQLTGSELLALLLESEEIKTLKPYFNIDQKRQRIRYALCSKVNEEGFMEFFIERVEKVGDLRILQTYGTRTTAESSLSKWAEKLQLCKVFCGLESTRRTRQLTLLPTCKTGQQMETCLGTCLGNESKEVYNKRAKELVNYYTYPHQNFLITEEGRNEGEQAFVLVEDGVYKGYGFLDEFASIQGIEDLYGYLLPRKDTKDSQRILRAYMRKHPKNVVLLQHLTLNKLQ